MEKKDEDERMEIREKKTIGKVKSIDEENPGIPLLTRSHNFLPRFPQPW